MAELEGRNTHKLYEKEMMGEVRIADEVVAIIAGLAATVIMITSIRVICAAGLEN